MVISVDSYRIAYMALPKAACTTVKAALARVDGDISFPPKEQHGTDVWHAIYPTSRFRPHRWNKFTGYWRFCVVRDPVKRLISCYTDRVVKRNGLVNSPKIRKGLFDLPTDPDPDFFFQNLKLYSKAASVIKHHVLPARLFLGDTLARYDKVYPVEELTQLADDLNAKTGRDVPMNKENSSSHKLTIDDLKPDTQKALMQYAQDDYRLMKDYYCNPLA